MTKQTVTLGIISDTHTPQRWHDVPEAVFDVFADVDMILHAGDIGELWVTDKLSNIAPVIAVHGNDETDAAQAAFPRQQMLTIAGHRLVLAHSHHHDWDEEMKLRANDSWYPKLAHLHSFTAPHDATIMVYGHTHIAMNHVYKGVQFINPGAIASGNFTMRMTVQSVAKLILSPGETPHVNHYDLKYPDTPFTPDYDIDGGFNAAYANFSEVFFTEDLLAAVARLRGVLSLEERMTLYDALMPLLHECWYHGKADLSLAEVQNQLATNPAAKALFERHQQ